MRERLPNGEESLSLTEVLTKNWVTLRQLAAVTGVTYQTVLHWKRDGKIQCVRVGGTWRVYEDELKRFLAQGNANIGNSRSDGGGD